MDTNAVNIRFFDKDINFIGEVDLFTSLFFISKWETYGNFEIHFGKFNNELFQKGNLIMLNNNPNMTGFIDYRAIKGNKKNTEDVILKGFTLENWFVNRITEPPKGKAYDVYDASIEEIMFGLVNINAVNPVNLKRKIPNLILGQCKNRGEKLKFQTRYKVLADELTKLSKASGLGWNITLDYKNKKFIFNVLEGKDLTANQNTNPPKIFSMEYDNILSQDYIDSNLDYKNMAIVAGQGEGENREIKLLNDNLEGLERREIFIDARDIEQGETGNLEDRGKIKLAEHKQINTFETKVIGYDYRKNWNLGDLITTIDKTLYEKADNRVSEVKETWERTGYKVEPTFGTPIPTPIEKIKQMIEM